MTLFPSSIHLPSLYTSQTPQTPQTLLSSDSPTPRVLIAHLQNSTALPHHVVPHPAQLPRVLRLVHFNSAT